MSKKEKEKIVIIITTVKGYVANEKRWCEKKERTARLHSDDVWW